MVSIPFGDTFFDSYFSYPDDGQKHPAVLLIHEVWGLTDHIKDVANRFTREGYVVLAPDLLSHTGITNEIDQSIMAEIHNPETRAEAQKKMREAMTPLSVPSFGEETLAKLKVCLDYLEANEHVDRHLFAVGFCFGGTYVYSLLTKDARLTAAVPFYGHAPEDKEVLKNIACPVLSFYGQKDEHLMKQLPQLEETMFSFEKNFRAVVYPQTGHAFFNDTNPVTYNKDAADDAWAKTLAFLEEQLMMP